ncbi:MAG TPA: hypothetical protein VKT77_19630, partial [Chthonomonadaceae bacterium]|nr:hypothetical protein [Chthonomonadaceae bacterium]
HDDSIYVADTGNGCVRRIKDGQVSTLGAPPAPQPAGAAPRSLPVGIAFEAAPAPVLVVADAVGAVRRLTLEGAPAGERRLPGAAVASAANGADIALPQTGDLIIGPSTVHQMRLEGTDEVPPEQAATVMVRQPVGIAPLGKGLLVTDGTHAAVMLALNGKAQVIAGTCSSGAPVLGFRDGTGRTALFRTVCGVATDGKRFIYVVDTGNNSVRRIDMSESSIP